MKIKIFSQLEIGNWKLPAPRSPDIHRDEVGEIPANRRAGQSLIELLLAIGLSSIFLPALLTGLLASREGKAQQGQRLEAVAILKETEEAVRNVREKGWADFAVDETYHPEISGSSWSLALGPDPVKIDGIFSRQVVISSVYRNTLAGPIVAEGSAGAVNDPSTKKVETTISWDMPLSSSIKSNMYLTRFLENMSYMETTYGDFNFADRLLPGVQSGVTVRAPGAATNPPQNTDDGEILLGAGGRSNWCTPSLVIQGLNLTGNGNADAIAAVEGKAFVGTGQNASGLDFINITVNNPAYPADPVASEQGTYDGNLKTNGVFGETVNGTSYAYLATDTNNKEVVILNTSNNPPTLITTIDIIGPPNADSVFAVNNILYVAADAKLFTYNISNRSSPQLLGSIDIPTNANKIIVKQNFAFLALNSTSLQLKIIDVTNPSSMQDKGELQVNNQPAQDLYVNDSADRVYLATSISSSEEVYIINTLDKEHPSLVSPTSKYETGGMNPKGIAIVPGNRMIIVGHNSPQYQVVKIDNENSPLQCAIFNTDNINGISSVKESDGDAYSYVITTNTSSEFRIIAGGPGGAYSSYGEFESATFDPGYTTANNRFTANFSAPSGTTLQFQVSMANLVDGSCPSTGGYTFIGFDGLSSTESTLISGQPYTFPFTGEGNYSNPGRCIRYKAYFSSTDQNNSPVLYDVTVNYSP